MFVLRVFYEHPAHGNAINKVKCAAGVRRLFARGLVDMVDKLDELQLGKCEIFAGPSTIQAPSITLEDLYVAQISSPMCDCVRFNSRSYLGTEHGGVPFQRPPLHLV